MYDNMLKNCTVNFKDLIFCEGHPGVKIKSSNLSYHCIHSDTSCILSHPKLETVPSHTL